MTFFCNICNKNYKSYQSLWNHNKKYHNNPSSLCNQNVINMSSLEDDTSVYYCRKCNKEFNARQNKWRHEKTCKFINSNECPTINELLVQKNIKLEEKIDDMSKVIYEMKEQMLNMMNKNCKMHPKTFQKINKQLNTINANTTVNNTFIVALGHEDLEQVLSQKEQLSILNKKYLCLDYLVKYIHFNDMYPQFKNIIITNNQNNLAYKYDKNENKFIAINKTDLLDTIINERMDDINTFYDLMIDKLDTKTKDIIETFINKMEDEKYKDNKKKDIKLIIYNNRDKVSKEVFQDLEIIV
jgi:hypothetical protein